MLCSGGRSWVCRLICKKYWKPRRPTVVAMSSWVTNEEYSQKISGSSLDAQRMNKIERNSAVSLEGIGDLRRARGWIVLDKAKEVVQQRSARGSVNRRWRCEGIGFGMNKKMLYNSFVGKRGYTFLDRLGFG